MKMLAVGLPVKPSRNPEGRIPNSPLLDINKVQYKIQHDMIFYRAIIAEIVRSDQRSWLETEISRSKKVGIIPIP